MAFFTEIHETCTGSIISILLIVKVHETCTGSIISFFLFFLFFPRTSGQEALYSQKEIEIIEFIEPVQVSCTLTLAGFRISEPVQASSFFHKNTANYSAFIEKVGPGGGWYHIYIYICILIDIYTSTKPTDRSPSEPLQFSQAPPLLATCPARHFLAPGAQEGHAPHSCREGLRQAVQVHPLRPRELLLAPFRLRKGVRKRKMSIHEAGHWIVDDRCRSYDSTCLHIRMRYHIRYTMIYINRSNYRYILKL